MRGHTLEWQRVGAGEARYTTWPYFLVCVKVGTLPDQFVFFLRRIGIAAAQEGGEETILSLLYPADAYISTVQRNDSETQWKHEKSVAMALTYECFFAIFRIFVDPNLFCFTISKYKYGFILDICQWPFFRQIRPRIYGSVALHQITSNIKAIRQYT